MRVELLGPPRVDGDTEALARRDRIVLSVLAVEQDGPVSVDRLSDALWGDDPPASAAKVVHGCISRLRRVLGHDAIATVRGGYRLEIAGDEVDLRRFERLLDRGRELLALGETDPAAHVLAEALELWSGSPVPDLDDWTGGRAERQRLLALRDEAQELWVAALLGAGRPGEALAAAVRLREQAPLREARWELLARAQYQCGRTAEAVATVAEAREVLARELGLDPGPTLVELQERMLRQDERLEVPDAPAATGDCPYPGLVPFGEEQAEAFLGRTEEIAACLERLDRDGVLVIAGPSGSGKSSLARAGVAAACLARGWRVRVLTASPGLAQDLADAPRRPDLLVADQLEHLTSPDVPARVRDEAFAALADQECHGRLVLVVRADRLGELADSPLASVVERGLLLLGAMSGDGLRQAVLGPAEHAGLLVEPGLVDLLVSEVEGEPGELPLLAHVLRSTWQRREGRTLTVAGYRAAGGVRGAIAQTAEALHDSLAPADRALLRELLLRLVARGRDGSLVAVPLPLETVEGEGYRQVVDELVDRRLLTLDGEHVHLAHEALTRAWPRLQLWLDEDVAGQRILRHVTVSATGWEALGRPVSELYRGVRLEEAEGWRDRTAPHLTAVERAFLDESIARRDRERSDRARRLRRTERTNRRLGRLLRSVAALSVLALVAGGVAGLFGVRANRASVAADARRVGAQALLEERIETSLLLAAGAVALDSSSDTRASLLTALGRTPALERVLFDSDAGAIRSVAVRPDGAVAAAQEHGVGFRFIDLRDGSELGVVSDGGGPLGVLDVDLGRAAFHPADGPVAVAPTSPLGPGPILLVDPATLEPVRRSWLVLGDDAGRQYANDVAWSSDGELLAAVLHRYDRSADPARATLAVWRVAGSALPVATTTDLPLHTRSVVWGADDGVIHTATTTTTLGSGARPETMTWDAATLEPVGAVAGIGHPLAVSPDGRLLAGVPGRLDRPEQVVVVDASTGEEEGRLVGHDDVVRDVVFDAVGGRVAAAADGEAIVWDVASGDELERVGGHTGTVTSVAFVPDGDGLVTAGTDGAVLQWDLSGERRLLRRLARASSVPAVRDLNELPAHVSVSPDGSGVVFAGALLRPGSSNAVGGIQLLDVATGTLSEPAVVGHVPWSSVVWVAPDEVVTMDPGGLMSRWDVGTGERLMNRHVFTYGTAAGLAGDELVQVRVGLSVLYRIDPGTGESVARWQQVAELEEIEDLGFAAYSTRTLATAPDGRTIAAFGGPPPAAHRRGRWPASMLNPPTIAALPSSAQLLLVDVRGPSLLGAHPLGFDGSAAAFDPSGERIAVVGRAGSVGVLDRSSGSFVRPPVRGHEGRATSVVWVDEGRIVATGGEDGRVALWDGRTGASLGSLTVSSTGHAAAVGRGPREHEVVVATTAGEVFSLDTRLEAWVDAACRVAGRSLTRAEWSSVAGARSLPDTCVSD